MHTTRVLSNATNPDRTPLRHGRWLGLLLLAGGMVALAPQAHADHRYTTQVAVGWGYQGPAYPPLVRVQPAPPVAPYRYLRSYTDPRPVVVWQPAPRVLHRHGHWYPRPYNGHYHGTETYYAPPVKQYAPIQYIYR